MNGQSGRSSRADQASREYSIALFGAQCWETILNIEQESVSWAMYGVGNEHSYGRLPGERDIHPWPIPRSTGLYLYSLIRMLNLTSGIEIGTSFAYSTLFIGSALARNNGNLTTCEVFEPKINIAKSNISRSGLSNITLVCGDAKNTVDAWDTALDFVFLDADPENYYYYLNKLTSHVKPEGILVIDNAVNHAFLIRPLIQGLQTDTNWESWIMPLDHGLLIAKKTR